MTKQKNIKRKLNKKKIFLVLIIFFCLSFLIFKILSVRITNIYISGNEFLSDQEIIEISQLGNYPKSINNLPLTIQKRLDNNTYILESIVKFKNFFSSVYINIKENYPLFFYQTDYKTVLYDGTKIDDKHSVPIVINQIPNTVYEKFLKCMKRVNKDVLIRMSEIKYEPNEVDEERFLITMSDGNYVYLNIKKFIAINKYIDIIKSFDNKKGILYLDSGEYFDIFDE